MFVGFYRNIFSMNAMTNFEKCRMQATYYGDTYPPDESSITSLLSVLAGKDPETKASLAFSVITAKLETSHSRKYWNYMVKNLVVLDRAIDENLFVREIAQLKLPSLEKYQPPEEKYVQRKLGDLVQNYYKYVREKANVYYNLKNTIHVPRDKRKDYYSTKTTQDILDEDRYLSSLCEIGMQVLQTGSHGHLKYQLTQHVFLLVLHTLLTVLSVQYAAFIGIIEKFFETDIDAAQECLEAFKAFLKLTNDLISTSADYQFIPGFQISLYELRNPKADTNLLNAMQEYITMNQKKEKHRRVNFSIDYFNIRPEDFHLRPSNEPDTPTCLERIRTSIQRSPSRQLEHEHDVHYEEAHEEHKIQSRPSLIFRNSLYRGFQAPVITDEEEIKKIMEDDLYEEEKASPEGKNKKKEATKATKVLDQIIQSKEEKVLTFKETIAETESDSIFEGHNNFYSKDFIQDIQTQYLNVFKKTPRKEPFEMKTLGMVSNHTELFGRLKDEEFIAKDYDEDMFDNFMSHFSKE